MSSVNVQPTVESIYAMAQCVASCANELEKIASCMQATGDLSLASEAANCVANLYTNLRIDLLITRPLRALGAA